MAIELHTGATESGKSWHVMNRIVKPAPYSVIFDPEGSFQGDSESVAPNEKRILELFRKFRGATSYKIIIRPGRISDPEAVFNQVVELSCALGRVLKARASKSSYRVLCVVDELTTCDLVSPNYFSRPMKNLILRGRHDFVDSHLIAQNPMAVHGQIRSQATKISSFYLNGADQVPIFRTSFGKFAGKISELPQYERLEWTAKGEIIHFGSKNQIIENFTEKLRKNSEKRKVTDDLAT